jgi:TRAP-type C4-dicarboxylate transport system permease small subunit
MSEARTGSGLSGLGHIVVRVAGALSAVCGALAAGMIVLAVAITVQMIWVRFLLNQSTVWQTEAVVYLMVAATMIGIPYVQRLRGHVSVDLLPMMLPESWRRALTVVTMLVAMVVVAIMVFYGFELWLIAWQRGWTSDTVWAVRLWIPYLALPVGFGLFLLQLIADMIALLGGAETTIQYEDEE